MIWWQYVYLMIPCYVANMVPVLVRKIPWTAPINKRLFGSHKTWRGLFFGTLAGLVVGILMGVIYWPFNFSFIAWGLLTGFGALVGDIVKSFFKRRIGIKPGARWIPFDQLDFVVGALVFGSFVFFPGWWILFILAFSFIGHIFVNHAAFYLRIRREKW